MTEAGGRGPWSSAAEINVLGAADAPLSRTGWGAVADSQETLKANNVAANALDGNTATFWHSRFSGTPAALPHYIIFTMTASNTIDGITYLPRQDGAPNGNIGARPSCTLCHSAVR